jgi:hypothetical protein
MKPLRSKCEYLPERIRRIPAKRGHCDKPTRLQASSEDARDMTLWKDSCHGQAFEAVEEDAVAAN